MHAALLCVREVRAKIAYTVVGVLYICIERTLLYFDAVMLRVTQQSSDASRTLS